MDLVHAVFLLPFSHTLPVWEADGQDRVLLASRLEPAGVPVADADGDLIPTNRVLIAAERVYIEQMAAHPDWLYIEEVQIAEVS